MIGILDPDGINNNPLTNKGYSDNYKKLSKILIWLSIICYPILVPLLKYLCDLVYIDV